MVVKNEEEMNTLVKEKKLLQNEYTIWIII